MNTEDLANKITDLLSEDHDIIGEPEMDYRSGGYFIDIDVDGEQFTILVSQEV